MTVVIDQTIALECLEKAVEMKGRDYVVSVCQYLDKGRPCCIVGVGLIDRFPTIAAFLGNTDYKAGLLPAPNTRRIGGLVDYLRENGFEFTHDAIEILSRAQFVQDGFDRTLGSTWGEALDAAKQVAAGP